MQVIWLFCRAATEVSFDGLSREGGIMLVSHRGLEMPGWWGYQWWLMTGFCGVGNIVRMRVPAGELVRICSASVFVDGRNAGPKMLRVIEMRIAVYGPWCDSRPRTSAAYDHAKPAQRLAQPRYVYERRTLCRCIVTSASSLGAEAHPL